MTKTLRETFLLNKDDELINPSSEETLQGIKGILVKNQLGSSHFYVYPKEVLGYVETDLLTFTASDAADLLYVHVTGSADVLVKLKLNGNIFIEGRNSPAQRNIEFNLKPAHVVLEEGMEFTISVEHFESGTQVFSGTVFFRNK